MEHLSDIMERALVSALNAAATIVAANLLKNGIPTVEVLTNQISDALSEAGESLSAKGAACMNLEWLKDSSSKKANASVFLGMIKGQCVVAGMRSRNIYDLSLALKAVMPAGAFNISKVDCMKVVNLSLSALGTKVSSAIASYLAPTGANKAEVLEQFSGVEEEMMKSVLAAVSGAVHVVLDFFINKEMKEE